MMAVGLAHTENNVNTQALVKKLNELFGNPEGNMNEPNKATMRKQARLVLEEGGELGEAVGLTLENYIGTTVRDTVDMTAVADAIGDLLTVVYGMGHIAGLDSDAIYLRVHESNMTKFIEDDSGKEAALQYYYDIGIPQSSIQIEGEAPYMFVRVIGDCMDSKGKVYPQGKFLKNMVRFREPDFSGLVPAYEKVDS